MLVCSHCGTSSADEARFCSACGRRLAAETTPSIEAPPTGPECELNDHHWRAQQEGAGASQTVTLTCWVCGAGHRVEIREVAQLRVSAQMRIFPSAGQDEVSEAIVQWSLIVLEASLADLRSQGYEVDVGDIVIEAEERA
jgi:hypothetical protein